MEYQEYDLGPLDEGSIVRVNLTGTEANVELVDPTNRLEFKAGRRHNYYGGHYKQSPAIIPVPRTGHWYVMVHLGGFGGRVGSSVEILS